MFEKLLEKLLDKIVGEYVEGISKEQMNVGIWSGNIDISNVHLKKNLFEKLGMPFRVRFGMINKLKIKIPWKSLSNSSVEIQIEGIYLLIEPNNQSQWDSLELNFIKENQDFIFSYSKNIIEELISKLKDKKEKGQGYVDGVINKIIDNLQIDIKNIHVRMESRTNPIKNTSFGITLNNLSIDTCDEKWKKSFVDRSKVEHGNRIIYKLLKLEDLNAYWNFDETTFFDEKANQNEIIDNFKKSILNKNQSSGLLNQKIILTLSTYIKLKQENLSLGLITSNIPEYNVSIEFDQCSLKIYHQQLQQLYSISNFVNQYLVYLGKKKEIYNCYWCRPVKNIKNEIAKNKRSELVKSWWRFAYIAVKELFLSGKRKKLIFSKSYFNNSRKHFLDVINRVLKSKTENVFSEIEEEDLNKFNRTLMTFKLKTIKDWLEEFLKDHVRDLEIEKKRNQSTGILGWWNNKKEITKDEENELDYLIRKMLENVNESNVETPITYPKYRFNLNIMELKVELEKNDHYTNENNKMIYSLLDINMLADLKKNGIDLSVSLKNMSGKLQKTYNGVKLNNMFLYGEYISDKMISFNYQDFPKNQPSIDKLILLNVSQINFICFPSVSMFLKEFLNFSIHTDISNRIEIKKNEAIDDIKQFSEDVFKEAKATFPKINIIINMESPKIILPFVQDVQMCTFWVLYPGNLSIEFKTLESATASIYDIIILNLEDIQFKYFNQPLLLESLTGVNNTNLGSYQSQTIFKDLKITVASKLFKVPSKTDINELIVNINDLELNTSDEFIATVHQFISSYIITKSSALELEKKEIMSKASLSSFIYVTIDGIRELYFVCVYNRYIYLIKNLKDLSQEYVSISLLQNNKIEWNKESKSALLNSKDGNVLISWQTDEMYKSWQTHLSEIIWEINKMRDETNILMTSENSKSSKSIDKVEESSKLNISIKFSEVVLKMLHKDQEFVFRISNMLATKNDSSQLITLQSIFFGIKHQNLIEKIIYSEGFVDSLLVASTGGDTNESQFIKINVNNSKESNVNTKADINIGVLFINYYPEIINSVIKSISNNQKVTKPGSDSYLNHPGEDFTYKGLLDLVNSHINFINNSDVKYYYDQIVETNTQISVSMKSINIQFSNYRENIPFINLYFQEFKSEISLKRGAKIIRVKLKDLLLNDLTNYPNTISSKQDNFRYQKLIYKSENCSHDILDCELIILDPQILNILEGKYNTIVTMNVNNMEAIYYKQFIQRVIDYLNNQLISSLQGKLHEYTTLDPSMSIVVLNEMKDNISMQNFLITKDALLSILKPLKPKIELNVNNSTICLNSNNPNTQVKVLFQKINLISSLRKNESRLLHIPDKNLLEFNHIWMDNYKINLQSISVQICQDVFTNTILLPFDIVINIDLPCFEEEYSKILSFDKYSNSLNPTLTKNRKDKIDKNGSNYIYNNTISIDIEISDIDIEINNDSFNHLMDSLQASLLFNDSLDHIYNNNVVSVESDSSTPIEINASINTFSVLMYSSNHDNYPHSVLLISVLKAVYFNPGSNQMFANINIFDLNYRHVFVDLLEIKIEGILNCLGIVNKYEKNQISNLKSFKNDLKVNTSQFINCRDHSFDNLCVLIESNTEKTNINILASEIIINLKLGVFMECVNIFKRTKIQSPNLKEEQKDNSTITNIDIKLNRCKLVFPEYDNSFSLIVQFDIIVKLSIRDLNSISSFKNNSAIKSNFTIKKKTNTIPNNLTLISNLQTLELSLKLVDFEIYMIQLSELYEKHFSSIYKRSILKKSLIIFDYNQFKVDFSQTDEKEIKFVNQIKVTVDELDLQISLNDIEIIYKVLKNQLNVINEIIQKSALSKGNEDNEEKAKLEEKKFNDYYIVVEILDINILFINDYLNILSPIMLFGFNDVSIVSDMNEDVKLQVSFEISCNFFNCDVFKWEPVLENSSIRMEYMTVKDTEKRGSVIKISTKDDSILNLNISVNFLNKISFYLKIFNQFFEKMKNENDLTVSRSLSNNSISEVKLYKSLNLKNQQISPLCINNISGYSLEIDFYKKRLLVDEEGKPVLKLEEPKSFILENNQRCPIIMSDFLDSVNSRNISENFDFAYKFISIKILHPEIIFNPIRNIDVLVSTHQNISIRSTNNKFRNKLIYSTNSKNDIREITISSPLSIVNELEYQVTLSMNFHDKIETLTIPSKEQIAIPFDCFDYEFTINVNTSTFKTHRSMSYYLNSKDHHFTIHDDVDNKSSLVLKYYQNTHLTINNKLVILPSVTFINNLPSPIKFTLFTNHKNHQMYLKKKEKVEISEMLLSGLISYSIMIPGYSETPSLKLTEFGKFIYEKQIEIFDVNKNRSYINIVRVSDGFSHFKFMIYSALFIVNEISFDMSFLVTNEEDNDKYKLGSFTDNTFNYENSSNVFYLDKKIKKFKIDSIIGDKVKTNKTSNSIYVGNCDGSIIQIPVIVKDNKKKNLICELGVKQSIETLNSNMMISSTIIQITPRTIFFNSTDYDIRILDLTNVWKKLPPKTKVPIYIYELNDDNEKSTYIMLKEKDIIYQSVYPIRPSILGSKIISLHDNNGSEIKTMYLISKIIEDYNFIILDYPSKHDNFIISNKTKFDISIRQSGVSEKFIYKISYNDNKEIGYTNPYGSSEFKFKLVSKDDKTIYKINIGLIEFGKKIYSLTEYDDLYLISDLSLIDNKKILDFYTVKKCEIDTITNLLNRKDIININLFNSKFNFLNIHIDIKKIGVSVIGNNNGMNEELFYLYLGNTQLLGLFTENQNELQFAIESVNIDSNYREAVRFPILLTNMTNADKNLKKNFINFHIILNNNFEDNFLQIKTMEFEVSPITITTDYSILKIIMGLVKDLPQFTTTNALNKLYLSYYLENLNSEMLLFYFLKEKKEWMRYDLSNKNSMLFIENLRLSCLKIDLTFIMNKAVFDKENKDSTEDLLSLFINSIGFTLLNIEDANILISGIKLRSVYDSVDSIFSIFTNHFIVQKKINIARIMGSLNIFGNPVSFFSNVGNGFVEFVEKPINGFVQGPLEGVMGIAEGSGNLVKTTVASAFNSVSIFTGSIGSGLAALSMDKEYLEQKNFDKSNKPKNVIDGVSQGVLSISNGIFSGITGVVTQPMKEAKKSGVSGFFLGMAKGIGGLITKPLGGILDATAQTAEGIKKTITVFDDKMNEKKIRSPRVFYSTNRSIKNYRKSDSEVWMVVKSFDNRNYVDDNFILYTKIKYISFVELNPGILVLSFQRIFLISIEDTNRNFVIDIEKIKSIIQLMETKIVINYYLDDQMNLLEIVDVKEIINKVMEGLNWVKYQSKSQRKLI